MEAEAPQSDHGGVSGPLRFATGCINVGRANRGCQSRRNLKTQIFDDFGDSLKGEPYNPIDQ